MSNLLLSLVSAIGIAHSVGKKGIPQRIITIGLGISILAFWFAQKEVKLFAIMSFCFFTLSSIILAILLKGIGASMRISIVSIALTLPAYLIFKISHWPIQILEYLIIFSALTSFWAATKKGILQSSIFGIFVIISSMNLIQVIKIFLK